MYKLTPLLFLRIRGTWQLLVIMQEPRYLIHIHAMRGMKSIAGCVALVTNGKKPFKNFSQNWGLKMEPDTKPKRGTMVKQVVELLKQGKSPDEIVAQVGCSKGTVSVQRYKLKKEENANH
jgi:DNA-binding NarL/FixJ family response regulator